MFFSRPLPVATHLLFGRALIFLFPFDVRCLMLHVSLLKFRLSLFDVGLLIFLRVWHDGLLSFIACIPSDTDLKPPGTRGVDVAWSRVGVPFPVWGAVGAGRTITGGMFDGRIVREMTAKRAQIPAGRLPEETKITAGHRVVELEAPLRREDQDIIAWLRLTYRESDPLAVDIGVCSTDGRHVLDRSVFREALLAALQAPVFCRSIVFRPHGEDRSALTFEFLERDSKIVVKVDRLTLAVFLQSTHDLVGVEQRADACARAVDGAITAILA